MRPSGTIPKNLLPDINGSGVCSFHILKITGLLELEGFTVTEAQRRAEEHLTSREEQRVEFAFWTGDLDNTPSLQTDVVTLNADLLEVATEGERHWASVHFSGTIRDTPGAVPASFEEVWNLVKPANGSSGWLLAGIQQMH